MTVRAVIVGVGSHAELAEFVDRSRADMAGTFLTRLKVGNRLVDASAVAHVYRRPAASWPLWALVLLLLCAVAAVAVLAGDATQVGQWRQSVVDTLTDAATRIVDGVA